jgi:hypothetical protein
LTFEQTLTIDAGTLPDPTRVWVAATLFAATGDRTSGQPDELVIDCN